MPEDFTAFEEAAFASEPTVLAAVLAELTGDLRWARDPRLEGLRRWRAGLEPEMDQAGRDFLLDASQQLEAFAREGGPVQPAPLDDAQLLDIARSAIDERLDRQFVGKLRHHLDPATSRVAIDPEAIDRRGLKVTIVGAGMSGLGLAFSLAQAGIDYEVLEMGRELGGIWFDNVYPECGVDTQAFQYAYDTEPNLDWSRFDVKRDEVLQYVRDSAHRQGALDRIEFGVKVETGTWDAATCKWRLDVTRDGKHESRVTDVLVVAVGSLNRPKIPEIPGFEAFQGQTFHTARWRDDIEMRGKNVALVGSGSSGVQVARSVAAQAGKMYLFVRSPHWMRPRRPGETGEVTSGKRWLLRNLTHYLAWYRFYLDWAMGDREHHRMVLDESVEGRVPSPSNDEIREELTAYIRGQLGDREDLVAKVTPTYPPYAKRLVTDNGWYATLTEPHVELVTSPIVALDASGIRTDDGKHYDVDVIGFATGFHGTRYFWPMDLVGVDGRNLAETFGSDDDLRAYLGVMMAGFPNLFSLQGPNTSIGHGGGVTFMSECQGRFILTCLKWLIENGQKTVSVKPEVVKAYNDIIDERLDRMVWTEPGLVSRFHNSRGRVVTNHPWTLVEFWQRTSSPDVTEFQFEPLDPQTESDHAATELTEKSG